jgi:predicted RND superfamily exporter protein
MSDFKTNGAVADYAYGRWLMRYRWAVIVVVLAAALAAMAGVARLAVNPDNRVFFSKDNPHLLALEELENVYSKDNNVLFVLAPKDGDVFTRDTLAAIEDLTEQAWQLPYSQRVGSITNFQHTRADGDDLAVSDLVKGARALSDDRLAEIRAISLSRPTLVNRVVSESGAVTSVNAIIVLPSKDINEVPETAAVARRMAADFRAKYPDIDLYLTGGIMIDLAFSEVPEQDMATLVPIMFGLVLLILGISLRTVTGTAVTLSIIVFSVFGTMGLAGWAGVVMNAGTMGAPVIILTLSVAHSVHILATLRQQMRGGATKRDAIVESLRVNMAPVFITSITTAIGFMTMNFSDAPPFRTLGNIVATGVMLAFALSVTLLPALMAVLPVRVRPAATTRATVMDRLGAFVVRRRNPLFWAVGALILMLASGIHRINLDDDFIRYFDEGIPIRVASDFTQANLTGLNVLEYSLPAGEDGGISDPNYLARLDRFAAWYRDQPKVVNVLALSDIFKRLNQNMHGDDPAFYRLPDNRELAAQYLLVYELSLPYGQDLNNRIDVAKSASRFTVFVADIASKEMRELDARAQAWLAENAPAMAAPGTGLSLIFSYISESNINSMLLGSTLALVVISFILIFALRSFRIGLISLVPNLVPAAMAFGLWGYISGDVGLAIAVVVAMTLGIVVDDTVHFLSKYLRARRENGMDPFEATRYAFSTVGMALWVTSVTLVAGFGALAFSGFKVNADMGLLSAATIAMALIADFLFLPTLLMKLDTRRSDAPGPV